MIGKKYVKWGILFVILSIVSLSLWSIGSGDKTDDGDYTSFENLYELMTEKAKMYHLIDVRTLEEYEAGHLPGARLIPYDVISNNLPTEKKDELIIVYCRSGRRSSIAKKALNSLGFTNVQNFGAYTKWQKNLIMGKNQGSL